MSRVIMVYHSDETPVKLFELPLRKLQLFDELKTDLSAVWHMFGKMAWTPAAAKAIQSWIDTGREPAPKHRRLEHYISRRPAQIIKLCMIMSAARASDMVIEVVDFEAALEALIEAELFMPQIFASMNAGNAEAQIMDDAWHLLSEAYERTQTPVPEWLLNEFLRQRLPPHYLQKTIDVMVKSHMIELAYVEQKLHYRPVTRH